MRHLSTSVRTIITIALPLIIGSLGHNIISMTDTIVLGRYNHEIEYAAIGLMAPAYLLITLIAMAISRGGQILIARRVGEGRSSFIGRIVQNMLYFELFIATVFFVITWLLGYKLLESFINEPPLLEACWSFLKYRIWGIYFTFIGAAVIALYSGIGRTKVIIFNAAVIAGVNLLLNYALVFGMFSLPEMGIRGSALASVIAEAMGMFVFLIYIYIDKENRKFNLFRLRPIDWEALEAQNSINDAVIEKSEHIPAIDWELIRVQVRLCAPIALQTLLGMGSWLVFFSFIENYGTHALAVSNAVRVLYLFLGVPTWGMGNATTTIISQLIGQGKKDEVFMTSLKISAVNLGLNVLISSCILIAPVFILSITTTSSSVIAHAVELMPLLFGMLMVIAVANIVYYTIVGTGAIGVSLIIQIITVFAYTIYAYWATELQHLSLAYAWCAEFVYFGLCIVLSILYLKSNRWRTVEL